MQRLKSRRGVETEYDVLRIVRQKMIADLACFLCGFS
jgi:hypothetical protein